MTFGHQSGTVGTAIKNVLFIVGASTLGVFAPGAWAQPSSTADKQTLYYIPHTHWEGAVFFTREEYLDMGLSHILSALRLLEKYPDYHFTLDQVAYFKPFLERYPEEAPAFRKFVAEGRLHIVGGMDVMPDVVKPGGELFVRQMQYGKGYCRKELGLDVNVAWMVDTFGHHPQMPQLLALAGFKSCWFCRGVPDNTLPSEFLWRGIDGTTIPAFWLPGFYGLFYGPPRDPDGFARFFTDRFNALNPHARGNERVGLAGVDVCEPEEAVPPMVRLFNDRPDAPFTIRCSGPEEFAAVVARRKDTPVIDGDFNPIFQGTYSSRIELRQATRQIEHKLLTTEKLAAFSNWLGVPTDDVSLWRAWEPLLFNQTHDLASGVMTDPVYEDTVKSYAFSERLADEMLTGYWDHLAARIDTRGDGLPVVVFNPQGWPRTEVVEVGVGSLGQDVRDIDVVDPSGAVIPTQIASGDRYSDGTLRQAKVCFLAADVPALGYATYRVMPRRQPRASEASPPGEDAIENEFFKVTFNVKSGEITSVFDKAAREEVLGGPANVVSRQEDAGDLWELYHALDGAMFIAATAKQPVPTPASALLSNASSQESGTIVRGPVFSEFHVAHAFGSGRFETRVRLCPGVRRIDIQTRLVNNEKHVRYQVLFPTVIKGGRNVQEIPFGAVERPMGVEYPAQNWADLNDGQRGVALLNAGLAGNVTTDGTMMLSLLRSEDLRGYNEGRPSDTGFELGVPRTFRYALVPHSGDWSKAGVFRQGLEFNCPLLVHKAAAHAGDLPNRMGMLEVSNPAVVLTAFKPGPDGSTILRVYEASGQAAAGVKVKLHAKITGAFEANLLEEAGRRLQPVDNTIQLDLHPFEIRTVRLVLAGAR